MTVTNLIASTVKAARANRIPGDTQMWLVKAAETEDGRAIAAGTVYQPQGAGMSANGQRVQRVVIQ